MGALYSGKRTLPAAWTGAPAPAQYEVMLGKSEPLVSPPLALGVRHALDDARFARHAGRLLDVVVPFSIERAGIHRVTLRASHERAAAAPLYVRFGGRHYSRWTPPAEVSASAAVLEAELEPGEHLLELHSADPKHPIDWDTLEVERVSE
jgi:hypothetical protein